jgi:hypothetical protein
VPDSTSTIHVLAVIDMSGSMGRLAADVRGGFNSYLDGLTADGGNYRLTVTVFDTEFTNLCTDTSLADAPQLDAGNYMPRGYTALLDAVGRTIRGFEHRVPTLPDGDRVILVVQTDGAENSSTEYTWQHVADLIRDRERTGRWSCVYLGQHADAWAQASRMGFTRASTIGTTHDSGATRSSFTGLTHATTAYAAGASAAETSSVLRSYVEPDTTPQ